jgi:hypothetical protein
MSAARERWAKHLNIPFWSFRENIPIEKKIIAIKY